MQILCDFLLQAARAFQMIQAGVDRDLHNPCPDILDILPLAAKNGDKHLLAQILGISCIMHHVVTGPVYSFVVGFK
ncbi:hypothetical protein D3C75_1072030 [compost metagenome]